METLYLDQSLKPSRWQFGLTALNGVIGDRLARNQSPLSVRMGFYYQNRPLAITPEGLACLSPAPSSRIAVFVHGMASHEQLWRFPDKADCDRGGKSYGDMLLADLGITPLYLRYNSGLNISTNGQYLASLLEETMEAWPCAVDDLTLVGHSLGGLVIRSACYYGDRDGRQWRGVLSRAVYLGTPHLGSPWVALGEPLHRRLERSDHPLAQRLAGILNGRSAGLKDIQTISLVDKCRQEGDGEAAPVPWLENVTHCFVAGSVGGQNNPFNHLVGDVLVTVTSAHARPVPVADIPEPPRENTRSALVPGVKHVALAHHHQVYEHLRQWLAAD